MKKILSLSMILTIILTLLVGCEKKERNNTFTSEEDGFSLEIPQAWQGKYKVNEEDWGTNFLYTGYEDKSGGHQEFFLIALMSKDDYEELLEDDSPATGQLLAEEDETVYIVNMPLDNIIMDEEKLEEYLEISLSVDEIKERFSIVE